MVTAERSGWWHRTRLGCEARIAFSVGLVLLTVSLPPTAASAGRPASEADAERRFSELIQPLLSGRCYTCHGPDAEQRQGGLRLDIRQAAFEPGDSGEPAIVPGDAAASSLVDRIRSDDPDWRMPPPGHGQPLDALEVQAMIDWIDAGAPYSQHWAYRPLSPPAPPQLANLPPQDADSETAACEPAVNGIDAFVRQRLDDEGLTPSPPAEPDRLLRRVHLDLIGLAPEPEQLAAFRAAVRSDPTAYERVVDQLLASPAFGEHWGRRWLDQARYADSAGYADDPLRMIWPYRDWVIRALNAGMPFDQFTREQLAGDLLEQPTHDQWVATGFHRNTTTNNEGGTVDEEFRVAAVVDRVNTTMAVWTGLTFACAQCHTHKYDPFTHEDYFRLYAIFNQSVDADRPDERPVMPTWDRQQRISRQALLARRERLLREAAVDWDAIRRIDLALRGQRPASTLPVMVNLDRAKQRATHIQLRGEYLSLGDAVEPGLPRLLAELTGWQASTPPSRLELADWLVNRANPLTPRVQANRMWESLFGIGLVATTEDFGVQGDRPSHPELLDWLAANLHLYDWDLKRWLRDVVLSATYRQRSDTDATLHADDPQNRSLARGPRLRLSAEQIRDAALQSGGLLSRTQGGPPVRPLQPKLGLSAAFGSAVDWQTSQGEDRFRRGIYTQWRRSQPYPSMATFGAPNREVCVLRREQANTPLQALAGLNDPVLVEAAQGLAVRLLNHRRFTSPPTVPATLPPAVVAADRSWLDAERVSLAMELTVGRSASSLERELLLELLADARAHFADRPEEARRLGVPTADDMRLPTTPHPPQELAAWSSVANVLLNLDEFLMKH
jgi:hypothetical protein